jgi:hypothetical protein
MGSRGLGGKGRRMVDRLYFDFNTRRSLLGGGGLVMILVGTGVGTVGLFMSESRADEWLSLHGGIKQSDPRVAGSQVS